MRSKPPSGQRHADLGFARPFRLDLPASGVLELLGPDIESVDNHASIVGATPNPCCEQH